MWVITFLWKLGSQSVLTIFFFFFRMCVCERLCLRENKVKHQAAKNKFPCGLPDACSEAWLFFIPFKHQLRHVATSGNVIGYSEPSARGLGSSPPLLKCPWARQRTSRSLQLVVSVKANRINDSCAVRLGYSLALRTRRQVQRGPIGNRFNFPDIM